MDILPAVLSEQIGHITPSISAMLVLGLFLSVSILADVVASRTSIPRISLFVLVGVCYALVRQLLLEHTDPRPLGELRESLISLALVMVAFLLGGELTTDRLRRTGMLILSLSFCVVASSVAVLFLGLTLLGYSVVIALSLAAVSVATDPAAVSEVVSDPGDESLSTRVILGIVAIDDAWGIVVFGLCMAVLSWVNAGSGLGSILHAGWELGGAVALGGALGLPAAWLTGRLQPGKPTQAEALALMLLISGLSSLLGVSELLAAMVTGFLIVNLSTHHERSFKEIEQIEWPFLVFFFILAGASIDLDYMGQNAWLLVAAYILLRVAGRFLGGYVGALLVSRGGKSVPRSTGLSLLPQAGVAMGMALLVAERFPKEGHFIMATVVISTIVFELFGPLLVKWVAKQSS